MKRDADDRELAELKRRLAEAEDALEAIRTGAVDALFIDGEDGPGVYTLASADRLYRRMIEDMGEGALTLSRDRTIFYCNRRFAEFVGRPQEAITGVPLASLVAEEHAARLEALGSDPEATCEVALLSADGRQVPVKVTASRLEDGDEDAVCLVVTDLRLRHDRDSLRDAHRRKDEFLATLAHELRNPLAPIAMASRVLRIEGGPRATQEFTNAVDIIDRQVAHMVHLVDDLLDVSRISRGKINLRRSTLDLCEVARTALDSVRHLIDAAGHTLELDLCDGPLAVDGDAVRLTQVVENLIGNAVKYTPAGGTIRVAAGPVRGGVVLRVQDTGIGLAPEDLERVFEMFWQAETGRTSTGLGLGLALTRKLVEMHGGEMRVESAGRGRGSTFEAWFPLASGPLPAAASAAAPTTVKATASILIVDDHRDSAATLGKLLTAQGHRVHVCHTGNDALKRERDLRPEVVVLDIGLPDLDGVEVGRRLRATRPSGELLLVALSGYGRDEDRARTTGAGFDHHFTKPLAVEQFHAAVNAFVRERS